MSKKETLSALVYSDSKGMWESMCEKYVSKSDKTKKFRTQADLFRETIESFENAQCQE